LAERSREEEISPLKAQFCWSLGVAWVVFQLCLPLPALAQPWAGSGTEIDPYQLRNANDIQAIGADPNYWNAHFRLQSDVDMSAFTGTDYNIIGSEEIAFTGTFDGNDHKIYNFTYQAYSQDDVGLFGYVNDADAIIKNVQFIDPNIDAGWGNRVGALIGCIESGAVIRCTVKGGFVSGDHSVGGLLGWATLAELTCCSTDTTVSGKNFFTGGLIANIGHGQVSNSYSVSTVTGDSYVGGLIGLFNSGGFIHNCFSAASVSGTEYVGAFIGKHWDWGTYSKCFWDNTINPSLPGISNRDDPNVVGLPTEDMHQMATFTNAGWDFIGESTNGTDDIWDICDGTNYPRHVWDRVFNDFVCPYGITLTDFAALAAVWLSEPNQPNWDPLYDISEPNDGVINEKDLKILMDDWLTGL
jgi:hypothetical protein